MTSELHLNDQQIQVLLDSRLDDAEEAKATQHIADCDTCRVRLSQLAEETELTDRLRQLRSHSPDLLETSLRGDRPAVLDRLKDEFLSRVTSDTATGDRDTWEKANALQDTSVQDFPPPPDEPHPRAKATEVPERLGRYKIEKVLGQGGQATVYKAYDTEMERHVALKIPKTTTWELQGGKKRFQKEVRAASRLDHPNICRNLDVGEIDGYLYLSMSYIEGRTLDRWVLANGSVAEILTVLERSARGLAAAHEAGVVHRDLKPSNIMVKADGEPVIMDFGLAHRADSTDERLTITGSVVGTPLYMSPEQVAGRHKEIGPATDLYTLGVILYEMLTGKAPYAGSMETVFGQILHSDPPIPSEQRSDLPPVLDALCQRAMAKEPAARFASATEFADALASARQSLDEPVSAPTIVTKAPATPSSRWPWLVASAGVLLVALAIAGYANDWFVEPAPMVTSTNPAVPTVDPSPSDPITVPPIENRPPIVSPTEDVVPSEVVAVAPTNDELQVSAEIHFQRAAQKSGYAVLETDLLPLRDNDKLQFHVEANQPAYVYLWWYDAAGKPTRLRPTAASAAEPIANMFEPPQATGGEKQLWHVLGAEFGYEMLLATVSRTPLSEAELKEFEAVHLRIAEQSNGGELLALTRGLIGTVASEKGIRLDEPPGTEFALLALPESRLGEMIVVSPESLGRGLIGTVSTVKSTAKVHSVDVNELRDLKQLLEERFDSYYGLVIRHEE